MIPILLNLVSPLDWGDLADLVGDIQRLASPVENLSPDVAELCCCSPPPASREPRIPPAGRVPGRVAIAIT